MIETTSETNIINVRQPMMYLCPSVQYNISNMQKLGYAHKFALVYGMSSNKTFQRTWGAHFNKTWEQMIRDTLNMSPEEFIENTDLDGDTTLQMKIYPKFGFCYEVHYILEDNLLTLPGTGTTPFQEGMTIFLTDRHTKSYYRLDSSTQTGAVIYIDRNTSYTYTVDIEMHDLKENGNCNFDLNYSYEKCVDDYVTNDLKTRLGCIPPLLSNHDHCGFVSKEKFSNLTYYIKSYAKRYMINVPTKAEEMCLKPCLQQKIHVILKDQETSPGSWATFAFNPNVKVLTEQANYNWFNFIVDIGSSLGTWAGLSAISLIDIGLHPITNLKSLVG